MWKKKLMEEVTKLDRVLPKVETRDITKLNDTILACAIIVTKNFETPMSKRDRVIRNLGEGTVEQKGRELEGRCEQSS